MRPGSAGKTVTGRRPNREPFEAIEVGIRRLRLLGVGLLGLAVAAPGGFRPGAVGLAMLAALAGLLLMANLAGRRLSAGSASTPNIEGLVAAQLGIDVVATVGALVILDPGPADGVWLVAALPVVHGAIRFGVIGGATVWLTVAVPVIGWAIAAWAPGDGMATMTETAGLLSIALLVGLPAGRAADHLTEEITARQMERNEIVEQAHLVSVLAVAADELATAETSNIGPVLVEAAVELGFAGAELSLFELATGSHGRVAAKPTGFVPASDLDPDQLGAPATPPGTVRSGAAGESSAILADDGEHLTVLTVAATDQFHWEPRLEAFEVLCRNGAAALHASLQRYQIDEAGRRLDHRRSHDHLTGLLNRAGCTAALTAVFERLAPGAEARVLVLDLNGFATINATGGRASGDEVLIEVGARLRRTSPPGAAVARLEDDRFAVATADPNAGYLAEHLRDILGRPIATTNGAVAVGASVGQVITADPGQSAAAVLRQAELRARARKVVERSRSGDRAPSDTDGHSI